MANFDKKVVVVTGASGVIGEAITREFIALGASVVATYLHGKAKMESIASSIQSDKLHVKRLDVCDRADVKNLMAFIEETFGCLDVLVNNAGINNPNDFDQITDEEWDAILSVNLKGPFVCVQEALPLLRKSEAASIVNIGSVSGQYGGPRTAHYAASKAGLISLSQVIARFVSKDGIRCNTLAPGQIESEMTQTSLGSDAMKNVRDKILLGRFGTAEEVAKSTAFLASSDSQYITAQTLAVNGGLYF